MRPLLTLTNLVLLTAVSFWGVQIFYRVILFEFELGTVPYVKKNPIRLPKSESIYPVSYYNHIVERNLFALKPEPVQKADKNSIDDLANTDLDIRLWGTVTEKNGSAYAVIEALQGPNRKKEQRLYKEGETVQNATIEKIYRDKILLNLEGEKQILAMEKYQSRKSYHRSRQYRRQPARLTRSIRRKDIEKAFQNINTVMRQARIRPRSNGMYISSIRRGSIFQRLGLKNGDIIQGVDGKQINSVDDAMNFYNSLKSGTRVALGLKRRGRPLTITYRIR
jgi:general secretion pathway protein C